MPPRPDPVGPDQTSVWSFPRPAIARPNAREVRVVFAGRTIAETRRGFATFETSHPPSYYIPPGDVAPNVLRPVAASTRCEWKGAARYFDVVVGTRVARQAAWSYPDPTEEFAALKDHVAFYAGRIDACFVDGVAALPQAGPFYGGWITPDLAGPFKGPPDTEYW